GQLRAAAAGKQGAPARGDDLGDGRADLGDGGEHVPAGQDPGPGVALVAADRDVEVAAVLGADGVGQPQPPQRPRAVLGAAAAADRVDGNADQDEGHLGPG